ncbi:hypothetical protein NW768_000976 [Fusarium equiseti]|uniref:DUF7580 domain-containing protein n=1 Tax=Fusarium equiseti TaxID=61235 RepID=A0ABQ8RUD7_FUSEQ|nr:hypothetical protein NW768_000976 [Fusarium equiseti]
MHRFKEGQKRALASRLALTLSLFLNSDYALNASEANSIFFVVENGRCELDLVYVTPAANDHDQNTEFGDSMSLYDNLAKTLLEIECGESIKAKEPGELKEWVDQMLAQGWEQARSDLVNLNNMGAKISYLTAVQDLLNFRRTYRKGSHRFKGRLFDIGAIAGEIIYSDIAQQLRSCIEPVQLDISGLSSSKEEFLFQQWEQEDSSEKEGREIVRRSAARTSGSRDRTTPVQLFDDKEEFEENRGQVHARPTLGLEQY